MSRKPGRQTMTKQNALVIRGVLLWLEEQPDADPLEVDVLTTIVERVERFAHLGGIVRVKVKNLGAPPSEVKRRTARENLIKARQKRFGRAALEWTPAEDALLRELWGATETSSDEIAERLDRPMRACQDRASTLGVRRMVDYHPARLTPLGRARLVKSRRQAAEASARRNQEMESAYQD